MGKMDRDHDGSSLNIVQDNIEQLKTLAIEQFNPLLPCQVILQGIVWLCRKYCEKQRMPCFQARLSC
jgi:hypothetical protein